MKRQNKMKIRLKMFLVFGLSVSAIMVTLSAGILIFVENKLTASLDNESQNILEAARENMICLENIAIKNYLRATTEKTKDVVAFYFAQFKDGEISEQTLKKKTSEVILSQRIGKTGYMLAVLSNGIMSIHPKAEGHSLANQPFWPKVDKLIKSATRSGYLEYDWKNPNEPETRKKSAFITYFAPMDLIIWASSYKDEFAELVQPGDFHDAILSLEVGGDGYPFIFDYQGNMIIHPMLEGKNLYNTTTSDGQYFIREMISRRAGKIAYQWKDPDGKVRDKIAVYTNIEPKQVIVAVSVYKQERYALLYSIQNGLLCAFCISMAVICIVVFFFARSISRPLKEVIGVLSSSSAEISTTVVQQESISRQQATAARQANTTMEGLGISSRSIEDQVKSTAIGAQKILDLSEEGRKKMEAMLLGMDTLKEKEDEIAGKILHLSEQAIKIGEITSLVSDFANETKMLAMNAAVEAVRAGEHGKGFSVLSVEIRKLADESKRSAERISILVTEIQKVTNSTVMATEEGAKNVERGSQLVKATFKTFQRVSSAIGDAVKITEQVSLNVQHQVTAVTQVVETMGSLNQGAGKASEGISRVQTGVQTLNEAVRKLNSMV